MTDSKPAPLSLPFKLLLQISWHIILYLCSSLLACFSGQLTIALPKEVLERYNDRCSEEAINLADIEGLVW